MTRYLWQQTGGESVSQVMMSATATTDRILREYFPTAGLLQQPEFNTREGSNNSQQAVYFLKPEQKIPDEAVVTQVQGNQVDLFLGGIDPRTLELEFRLTPPNHTVQSSPLREGLWGKRKIKR